MRSTLKLFLAAFVLFSLPLFGQVEYSANKSTFELTVSAGGSVSQSFDTLGRCVITGIAIPAGWNGTTISFQVGFGNSSPETFGDLWEYDEEVTMTVRAGKVFRVQAGDLWGYDRLKIRSGTSTTAVVQPTQKKITVFCKGS